MIEIEYGDVSPAAKILVVGVGGSGGNAVNHMARQNLEGAVLAAVNTDAQHLEVSAAHYKLLIGEQVTNGLGTGGDPEKGRQAAEASEEEIKELLQGFDMAFVTCGLGGGTGTGAGPVVAKIAKEMGLLVVGVVTKPFPFEGRKRMEKAKKGLERMREACDSIIVISNQKLLEQAQGVPISEAFRLADDVLYQAVHSIVSVIQRPGVVNRDFSDIKSVMEDGGLALIGVGEASGENRAVEAARKATRVPLLDEAETIEGAKSVLVSVMTSPEKELQATSSELNAIMETIRQAVSGSTAEDPEIFMGISMLPELEDRIRVAVIATGLDRRRYRGRVRRPATARPVQKSADSPLKELFQDYNFTREEPDWGGTGSLA